MSKDLIAQLDADLKAASTRVSTFRNEVQRQSSQPADPSFGARVLQEIEVAHEELRVVEEELHSQADELVGMREALEAERRRYNELFDAAPEAYLVTDLSGNVIEANQRAGLLFQLDPLFLASKPLAAFIAPAERGKFRELLGAIRGERTQAELQIQPRKSDKPIWVSLTAEPATGAGGRSAVVRWMLRSIQAEKQRGEQQEQKLLDRVRELESVKRLLEHLLEREQDAHKAAVDTARQKDLVLGEVAHELRSPLGSIAGWLHVLTQGQGEPGTHLRALLSMTRGVRALARLVEDLIEHTRFERHAVTLNASTTNLLRILVDVIEDLRPIADLKNVAIGFNAHPYKIEIQADPWRLSQVFRNVIGNAIKFTPENGVVNVNVRVGQHRAVITVTDTGSGIPSDTLKTIFEPFAQVRRSSVPSAGLGLGLSIAKRLVELHGGMIEAESPGTDNGSTFRIVLPLLAPN